MQNAHWGVGQRQAPEAKADKHSSTPRLTPPDTTSPPQTALPLSEQAW